MAEATPVNVTELPEKGPVNDEALSQKDGADDIADLLGDDLGLDPDLEEGSEEGADAAPSDEDDVDVSEDVDDTAAEEPSDGPDEVKGGRFAPDTAKVTLEDGTVISVAELKRGHLFQRDYSKKTEELARERETVTTRLKEVDQVAERTSKEREFLIWFAETNVPKIPEPPTEPATVNPLAHLQYAEEMRHYEAMANSWRRMKAEQAQEAERLQGETLAQTRERLIAGANELATVYPDLKDKTKAETWWRSTASEAEQNYGFSESEILGLQDPRMVRALRDANAYRRAKAKAPAIQQEMGRKPVMIQGGGKRSDPKTMASRARQQSSERLSRTHSMRDGIDAIAHLID